MAVLGAALVWLPVHLFASNSSSVAGTFSEVHFTDYTPLSGNMELTRRMLSPLAEEELTRKVAAREERALTQSFEENFGRSRRSFPPAIGMARDPPKEVDARYGGLAAPQSDELEAEIDKPAARR